MDKLRILKTKPKRILSQEQFHARGEAEYIELAKELIILLNKIANQKRRIIKDNK